MTRGVIRQSVLVLRTYVHQRDRILGRVPLNQMMGTIYPSSDRTPQLSLPGSALLVACSQIAKFCILSDIASRKGHSNHIWWKCPSLIACYRVSVPDSKCPVDRYLHIMLQPYSPGTTSLVLVNCLYTFRETSRLWLLLSYVTIRHALQLWPQVL